MDPVVEALPYKDALVALLDPARAAKLRGLKVKYNTGLDGSTAPEFAAALAGNNVLTTLDLNSNDIGDDGAKALAPSLKAMPALTTLDLVANKIGVDGAKALAPLLKDMPALTTLSLHSNKIGDDGAKALAPSLKDMPALTTLELSFNNIGDDGRKALALAIKACPGVLSKAVIGRSLAKALGDAATADERAMSNDDLLAYWRSVAPTVVETTDAATGRRISVTKGPVTSYRSKLIICGFGGVGKTSLLNALQECEPDAVNAANKKINRKEAGKCAPNSTTGIDIVRFAVPHPDHPDTGEPITFSCWDFAGQQTYYSSHQLFLTLRYVYVVCFNGREDDDGTSLAFWLDSLASIGGGDDDAERPSVLLVATKKDENMSSPPKLVDILERVEKAYKGRLNIVGIHWVNSNPETVAGCVRFDGVADLKKAMVATAKDAKDMGTLMNQKWIAVETAVAALKGSPPQRREWFQKLCGEHGVTDGWSTLLDMLHRWGAVHIVDVAGTQLVFPDPAWLMTALKLVISHEKSVRAMQKAGVMTVVDVKALLSEVAPDAAL
jgi:GTPase SAR1 family protein